jgi:hypothetical protein
LYITVVKLLSLIFESGGEIAPEPKNYIENTHRGMMVRLHTLLYKSALDGGEGVSLMLLFFNPPLPAGE